ncbi:hypothetical protein CEXT_403581 [Caerostris extrusa]|uniref:Secreted protein n=1 Tax=Caerostris extrusa TaxID=172846 RepID=A0AAV4RJH6_CAEEX|nr:hypothetical protein CEXT_403581 [Caerostris extrusa]
MQCILIVGFVGRQWREACCCPKRRSFYFKFLPFRVVLQHYDSFPICHPFRSQCFKVEVTFMSGHGEELRCDL